MESSTEKIRVTRIIRATKERVFRAWTDPSQLKSWWSLGEGWNTLSAEVDLRVGGKISFGNQPTGGGIMLISGEFLAIEPPDRLAAFEWNP